MNYLQLCQRLHQEIGAGPGEPGDFPTAVAGQTGLLRQIVTWVDQAWEEIQLSQRWWLWMRGESIGQELVPAGDNSILLTGAASDFDELLVYSESWRPPYMALGGSPFLLMYRDDVGTKDNQEVYVLPWQEYTGYYDSDRWGESTGRPRFGAMSVDNKTFRFFPKADVPYRLQYQYRKALQKLTADATVPALPEKYHILIVYLAMVYYGRSNENNRVSKYFGNGLFDRSVPSSPLVKLYSDLCNEQLPVISAFGER
ncbi:MAG: hypothetical protein AB7O86_12200 [Porticoccaceae bacterium]